MSIDKIILYISWLITITLLLLFVPKKNLRQAIVIFLSKQVITWLFGLLVVEYKLIEYPVRFFDYTNRASFTFEFFVYPAICVLFNLHYPNQKNSWRQFLHYANYCTAITIIESILEKHTNVIHYLHWSELLTWITLFITFYISRKFYLWFFRLKD